MSAVITGDAPRKEALAYVNYLEKKYNRKLKSRKFDTSVLKKSL